MWHRAISRQRLRRAGNPWDGRGFNPKLEDTGIERIMAQILGTLGVEGKDWHRQYAVVVLEFPYGNHHFDFAIPSKKLLIECDGCFVHGCPECFPEVGTRPRDAMIDAAAEAKGWRVLRFWQHEIESDATNVRRRIEGAVRGNSQPPEASMDNPFLK